MRNDREVACDTSVLKMLNENDYKNYGNTLTNFVEKVSISPFPFAASLSGNMKQMKRRIISIALQYINIILPIQANVIILLSALITGIVDL